MTLCLSSPCLECKKRNDCADGNIIQGAVNTVNSAPTYGDQSWHRGQGNLEHTCNDFEKVEE